MNYLKNLQDKRICIFLFHGVIKNNYNSVRNYNNKHISKEKFFTVLTSLINIGVALTMDEVIYHLLNKKPFPDKSFSITFDDGFENNFSIARPILQSLKIPATFYLASNFIDKNKMSWIDRVSYAIDISSEGKIETPWGEEAFYNDKDSKIACLKSIRKNKKNSLKDDFDDFASLVEKQLKLDKFDKNDSELDLKMNWSQVKQLSKDSLFTIGGHGHNHKILSYLSEEKLRYEVNSSLNLIQKETGITCNHYSYPEGQENYFNNEVIECLKESGIVCCPTALDGVNTLSDDLFHLKRIMPSFMGREFPFSQAMVRI